MSEAISLTSELRARIIEKIGRVLSLNHGHPEKKRYLESRGRLNFACPYCGDSTTSSRKKRGNLYWNDLYFHCYNCSEHKSLDNFLKDFDLNFEGEERVSVISFIQENRKSFNLGEALDFYLFEKIEELALSFDELCRGFNVYPVNSLTYRAYPYLKSRLLHHKLEHFGYDPKRKELYVFNLDRKGKIVGFQTRALEENSGPKYKTWNIQRIYDRLRIPLEVNEEELEAINKISMLFGILRVDMGRDFTIFEGPIDAMFMNNAIGLTGVKKKIVDFDSIPTARYMLDHDREGTLKMIEKIKGGQKVFLWEKLFKEYRVPRKVKDLNDLVKYEYKERTGCLENLDNFFSNDPRDIFFL